MYSHYIDLNFLIKVYKKMVCKVFILLLLLTVALVPIFSDAAARDLVETSPINQKAEKNENRNVEDQKSIIIHGGASEILPHEGGYPGGVIPGPGGVIPGPGGYPGGVIPGPGSYPGGVIPGPGYPYYPGGMIPGPGGYPYPGGVIPGAGVYPGGGYYPGGIFGFNNCYYGCCRVSYDGLGCERCCGSYAEAIHANNN
ncbi:glycine-rich cell wall structural protein-like isoform X4 [Cannabis sativa]|uniref:glycine-rich cell wall structural protein-like isoform X4 n=1 Tax=Cannabis sativa TaxID=3483 RepID=UPI0029C9C105|nr:glycine-rich cell wall structural protein-like isoform X4 [Cannabis sativa]